MKISKKIWEQEKRGEGGLEYLAMAESCPSSSFTFMSFARVKTADKDIAWF